MGRGRGSREDEVVIILLLFLRLPLLFLFFLKRFFNLPLLSEDKRSSDQSLIMFK